MRSDCWAATARQCRRTPGPVVYTLLLNSTDVGQCVWCPTSSWMQTDARRSSYPTAQQYKCRSVCLVTDVQLNQCRRTPGPVVTLLLNSTDVGQCVWWPRPTKCRRTLGPVVTLLLNNAHDGQWADDRRPSARARACVCVCVWWLFRCLTAYRARLFVRECSRWRSVRQASSYCRVDLPPERTAAKTEEPRETAFKQHGMHTWQVFSAVAFVEIADDLILGTSYPRDAARFHRRQS